MCYIISTKRKSGFKVRNCLIKCLQIHPLHTLKTKLNFQKYQLFFNVAIRKLKIIYVTHMYGLHGISNGQLCSRTGVCKLSVRA